MGIGTVTSTTGACLLVIGIYAICPTKTVSIKAMTAQMDLERGFVFVANTLRC